MEKEFTDWFEANEKRFAHGQFDDKQIAYSAWLEGRKAVKNNAVLPHVSGSLPDKFKDIIRFIESDLMEVKLYGNDGFDNQEELDGKEYLARLIKDAVGNDR
jgi:hypothetical protein